MSRLADRLLIACAMIALPFAAEASPSLSVFLKGYYTDYQIVLDCLGKAHLTSADAETAKSAIAKIEAYYLHRDPSINKDRLQKEAVANKNQGFKMLDTTNKVDVGQYCRVSLNELVAKEQEIEGSSAAK